MRKRHTPGKGCWLWLSVAVVWTLVIWRNSLFPAEQSAVQSSWVMEALGPLLSVTALDLDILHMLVRKLAHMTEFALLGAFWTAALKRMESGGCSSKKERLSYTLLICVLTAMTDETIQAFVPGRGSLVTDVWIDALGAAIGIGISWFKPFRTLRIGRGKKREGSDNGIDAF